MTIYKLKARSAISLSQLFIVNKYKKLLEIAKIKVNRQRIYETAIILRTFRYDLMKMTA